jgi:hypothetical protein
MAIRFQCPACSQPIEVDDADANHQVVCFYCRAVVTAPAVSHPPMTSGEQKLSSPGRPEFEHISEGSGQVRDVVRGRPVRRGKVLGMIGFFSALAVLIPIAVLIHPMSKFVAELEKQGLTQMPQEKQMELIQEKSQHLVKENPQVVIAILGIFVLPVIAFGFSLAGLLRNSGRSWAVAGLVLSSAILLTFILSMITMLSRGLPSPT